MKLNGTTESIKRQIEPLGESGAWVTRHIEGARFKLSANRTLELKGKSDKKTTNIFSSQVRINKAINFERVRSTQHQSPNLGFWLPTKRQLKGKNAAKRYCAFKTNHIFGRSLRINEVLNVILNLF